MSKQNWQGWAALVLAGLALLVAFSGRGHDRMYSMRMQAAHAAPQFEGRFDRMPDMMSGQPGFQGQMPRAERMGPGMMGMDGDRFAGGMLHERRGGFFGGFFALLGGLTKLAALGALAWLLLRIFQQRKATPPSAAGPTTPAGHDPRVE